MLLLLAADAVGEVKLLAVTCTAGNTLQQHAVRNTLRLLRAANRLDSFPGDDADLDGLVQQESAVVALARIASEQRGELTLVCLAPLTTVALAFNFACDPEAAHIVLDSVTCPVHITPWETCADSPIELLVASGGGLAMELVTAADRSVLTAHSRTHWVTCDALTVAALLRPALVARASPRHVAVELAGSRTRGQMVPACVLLRGACPPACPGPAARLNRDAPPARLIHAFDVPAFKDLLLWAAPRWTAPPRPTTTA
ncbi:hypothetical protein FOCC_FOCC006497 [Frankliniella occidentalis]|nr:hypothetical protein FOCC_FOCC006497 [Frankliniella occidentalis]